MRHLGKPCKNSPSIQSTVKINGDDQQGPRATDIATANWRVQHDGYPFDSRIPHSIALVVVTFASQRFLKLPC